MAFLRVSLFVLLVLGDCYGTKEEELSIGELLWRANKDVVRTKDEPLVIDDIAYDNENERNADPCTTRDCKWVRSGDGMVYIPYILSEHYTASERAVIQRGMMSLETTTCIRFVPRVDQRDFLFILPGHGCYTFIGRLRGGQNLSLSPQGCVYLSMVQHMLLHVLGFNHEQCRSDRDQHIRVLWDNIEHMRERHFFKVKTLNQNTPYDYNSVMHSHRLAFSRNGQPTLEAFPDPNVEFGRATEMNQNDIDRVNRLYSCTFRW